MVDDYFITRKETGPMELEDVPSDTDIPSFTRRTIDKLENVFNNDERSILAVRDWSSDVCSSDLHFIKMTVIFMYRGLVIKECLDTYMCLLSMKNLMI